MIIFCYVDGVYLSGKNCSLRPVNGREPLANNLFIEHVLYFPYGSKINIPANTKHLYFPYGAKIDIPANTKHLHNICTMAAQRRRPWAAIVYMLYKCFVFVGVFILSQDQLDWLTELPLICNEMKKRN